MPSTHKHFLQLNIHILVSTEAPGKNIHLFVQIIQPSGLKSDSLKLACENTIKIRAHIAEVYLNYS